MTQPLSLLTDHLVAAHRVLAYGAVLALAMCAWAGPAAASPDAHAPLLTAGQSGTNATTTLRPPLAHAWHRALGASTTQPVIAGDHVFAVATVDVPRLFALDRQTGATLWQAQLGGASGAQLVWVADTVIALDASGTMRSFDAITGSQRWQLQLHPHDTWRAHLAAGVGLVYAIGEGDSAALYAIDAANGTVEWSQPLHRGGGAAATAHGRLLVSGHCADVTAFDIPAMAQGWAWYLSPPERPGEPCTTSTALPRLAAHGGRVAVDMGSSGTRVLDGMNGRVLQVLPTTGLQSLTSGEAVFVDGAGSLRVHSLYDGSLRWTLPGSFRAASVGGPVVWAVGGSQLAAFDIATGHQLWARTIDAPSGGLTSAPTPVDGMVLLAASDRLLALREAPDCTPPAASVHHRSELRLTPECASAGTVRFVIAQQPRLGTATVQLDGSISYRQQAPTRTGVDSFTFTATDARGTSDPVTATVTLTNTPPTCTPAATFATRPGVTLTGALSCHDADGDQVTFTAAGNTPNGEVAIDGDGTFSYTPAASFTGSETLALRASDGPSIVNVGQPVHVTDGPPICTQPGAITVPASEARDARLTCIGLGPLHFEAAASTAALAAGVRADDRHAITVRVSADGDATPAEAEVSLAVRDDDANTTAVRIPVRIVEPTPTCRNDAHVVPGEETTVVTLPCTVPGAATIAGTITVQPQHGALVDLGAGRFAYTPEPGYVGSDGFSYTASAGHAASPERQVALTVAMPPSCASMTVRTRPGVLKTVRPACSAGAVLGGALDVQAGAGRISVAGGGTRLAYRAHATFLGTTGFSIVATDPATGLSSKPVRVKVVVRKAGVALAPRAITGGHLRSCPPMRPCRVSRGARIGMMTMVRPQLPELDGRPVRVRWYEQRRGRWHLVSGTTVRLRDRGTATRMLTQRMPDRPYAMVVFTLPASPSAHGATRRMIFERR